MELGIYSFGELIADPSQQSATSLHKALYNGTLFQAKWWTRNQTPGDPNGPWQRL